MRLSPWLVWILTLHTAAQHPPPREEGGVRPAAGTRGPCGRPAARRTGSAAVIGPPACGSRCCVGWTFSPGTRRCTKPRCLPRCHGALLCRQSNRCVCPRGFHGYRSESLPLTGGTPDPASPNTGSLGAPSGPVATTTTARPGPGASDPIPLETLNVQQDAEILNAGVDKGDSSPTFPQEGRRAERTETQDSNDLQEKEEGIRAGPAGRKTDPSSSQTVSPHLRQMSPPEDQGVLRQETSTSSGIPNPESRSGTRAQRSEEVAGTAGGKKKKETRGAKTQSLSLREAQAVMLRKTLSPRRRGDRMAALLMKHIEKERKKVLTVSSSPDSSSSSTSSSSTGDTQKGQYSRYVAAAGADGQTLSGGRGVERLQVTFTPTVCQVRCSQDQCVNYCEQGNVTTLYSSTEGGGGGGGGGGRRDSSHGPGFRVFLCPLLCKNGGVCLQKDRCLCPPGFSGKFCQVPIASSASSSSSSSSSSTSSSTNEIVKPALVSAMEANQELTQSEFLLPLRPSQETGVSGAPGPSMVKVIVQHAPKTSTSIHQVQTVSRSSPALRMLSSSSSGSAGAPAPAGVQAQTVRGAGPISQQAGFKYCFREVKDGQCSSPLPGLRSRDICCQGIGKAWGTTECVLCPDTTGKSNSSCPAGFERDNGMQCVDVNECLQPGLCENGICVNTRGRYSCVCRAGFILDASHGICISQSVISEEKGQCHRVLGSGRGPTSCSLPILRSITKQICCCSRVGRAWGPDCQRCPHFGSVAFKEICPAGPGYHYSASALQFNQRATEQLGARGAPLVTPSNHGSGSASGTSESSSSGSSRSRQRPASSGATADETKTSSGGTSRPSPAPSQPPRQAGSTSTPTGDKAQSAGRPVTQQNRLHPARPFTPEPGPRPPSSGSQGGGRSSSASRPDPPATRDDPLPPPARPPGPEHPATTPQARVQTPRGVCESRPGVCGPGVCVQQPGGTHTCVCDRGHQLDSQRAFCRDVNECVRAAGVCAGGECVNTLGSFRCVCSTGYKSNSQQTGCQDVDECEDALRCPGQQCVNTQGSYHCVSCRHGYGLVNGVCTDVDECRLSPCSSGRCENTPGSYHCVCRHGYKLQNNTCTDVDECAEPSQCPGQMCVNSVGSYRCATCGPGYTLTNRQCTDVDECVGVGVCEAERVCVNTVGSFRCECASGYQTAGPGRKCRDVNECLQEDSCPKGVCVNSPGSFSCLCPQGFSPSDNRTACIDVDECVEAGLCVDGRCVNTEGSFQCQCETGFTSNPERTACLDVDECVQHGGSVCVMSQQCENTIGSYRCITSCQPGYQVTPTGGCEDLDECSNQTQCGHHASCQNLVGTFLCVCDQGFTSADGGATCEDEDECVSRPEVCGSARCENVEGSFMCECDHRGHEFDTSSRRCVNTDQQAAERLSGSSSFHLSVGGAPPLLPPLPAARPGELRECYYNLAEAGTCSLLATNTSQQECCCTVGEGWGLGCQYHGCPPTDSVHFPSLCPSGRGYVTTGPGAFSYTDVDECKRFHPEVCKNGVCVNNIPGYNCYCPSGYVYNNTLLECVDHDECEEESCVGGACVNTVGSYYCSCAPPLQLDDTQRHCVNSSHLPGDENLSLCWQHVTADLVCQSPLLGAQVTFTDCCCLYGEGWGMECALCPPTDSDDYASLCTSVLPPLFPESFSDFGPEPGVRPGGRGGARESSPPYFPPYSPDSFPPAVAPDYEDYSPAGGSSPVFRGRTPVSFGLPEGAYQGPEFRPPSFRPPPDPRAERAFGARPPPPSRRDGPPISLAPLPGAPYRVEQEEGEEEEGGWRQAPPFPPFTERRAGAPRRLYERRYESYVGLNAAEDCGILHGCENGRCIRVAEGYTCDCYQGYGLDTTSMTCTDLNECEASVLLDFPCVNARCVNTAGSFRCVCRRGYIMSRRPNHCVAA